MEETMEDYYTDMEYPCEKHENLKVQQIVQAYVHSFICVLGLLGNGLVIATIAFYKTAKSMTDVYLLNVAIADVLFVITLPLIIYNEQHNWEMGNWACKFLRGLYSINLYTGTLLLACISTDRYIAIVQARRSFRIRSRTILYSKIICITIWALAGVLSIPTFVYSERYNSTVFGEDSQAVCYLKFETIQNAKTMKTLIPSTQVTIGFFLPFVIMGFCYCSIVVTLVRSRTFQRHKAVRVVLAVVVVFVACHLPYNITLLYYTLDLFKERDCQQETDLGKALMVTESLAYLQCCLNPILYAFIGVKFRSHFRKILQDLWCLGKKYIYSRRSSRQTTEFYVSTRKSTDGSNNENGSSFTM